MKIDGNARVRPARYADRGLRRAVGRALAQMSEEDAQAVILRYAELQAAQALRRRWHAHAGDIAGSMKAHDHWVSVAASDAGLACIAGEVREIPAR